MIWLILIPVVGFSVILHEVAHGLVAKHNGDMTAHDAGRLTLNPIPHIDPFTTIVLPALLIFMGAPFILAGAKPVPVNPANFRNWRRGVITVSLAGIAMNLALAVGFGLVLQIYRNMGGQGVILIALFGAFVFFNLLLALFNLIPIPPLDGSRVVALFLPREWRSLYQQLERWGFVVIVLLLYFGLWRILVPVLDFMFALLTSMQLEMIFVILQNL